LGELTPGLKGEASHVVTDQDTAAKWGSGLVNAYSSPAMIGLMESASVSTIQKYLNPGDTSVGVEISVKHFAPTPVGKQVWARAQLLKVENRRLTFKVEAWDDEGKISEGLHVRAIVNAVDFSERLKQKAR
jgi:predicted thioesterase